MKLPVVWNCNNQQLLSLSSLALHYHNVPIYHHHKLHSQKKNKTVVDHQNHNLITDPSKHSKRMPKNLTLPMNSASNHPPQNFDHPFHTHKHFSMKNEAMNTKQLQRVYKTARVYRPRGCSFHFRSNFWICTMQ